MSSRKFASIFIAIFILGAFPLLLVQPSGAASAGLSAGFSAPVQHIFFMFVCLLIGIWSTVLGGYATIFLPSGATLMLLTGGLLKFEPNIIGHLNFIMMGTIMLFAIIVSIIRSRLYLISMTLIGSIAFHLGYFYISVMPELTIPTYYLLGAVVANMLIMGIGICIGITVVDDMQKWLESLRTKTAAHGFLSFFL